MNDSPQRLKHSVGRPFWIGCLVGPILFIIFCGGLGILQNSFTFWFFTGVAVVVFGPVGGMVSQSAHDLYVAGRLRLIHVWDFFVFTAIAIALVVAGEALFHASGKQGNIDMFRNRTFDIAGAFIILMLFVYAISKNLAHLLSWHTWLAILLTIALLAVCSAIYKLTGIHLSWIMVIGTALWAAIDSTKIHLKRYESGISYGPVVLFFGFVLLWFIAFPWYLIVRHKIKTGTAVLKVGATNGT
jgi:FtsH-binding integral membrane protein